MTIQTTEYRGFTLRAYSQQISPSNNVPFRDPSVNEPNRFSVIVQIDSVRADSTTSKRYSPGLKGTAPVSAEAAIELALQYGRDIIDGKVQAGALYNARSRRFSHSAKRFRLAGTAAPKPKLGNGDGATNEAAPNDGT